MHPIDEYRYKVRYEMLKTVSFYADEIGKELAKPYNQRSLSHLETYGVELRKLIVSIRDNLWG